MKTLVRVVHQQIPVADDAEDVVSAVGTALATIGVVVDSSIFNYVLDLFKDFK